MVFQPWYIHENFAHEFVFMSQTVSRMSGSSYLVCGIGGNWRYSYCFVGSAARIRLKLHVAFLCTSHLAFFSIHFVSVHVVHPYSSTDTDAARKKSSFISLKRLDFHQIKLGIKLYRRCSLKRVALPLNNPQRLIYV